MKSTKPRGPRFTIEDWMQEVHPELEEEIPLVPGMVLWKPRAAGDSRDDGEGVHYVYIGRGELSSLTSGLNTVSSDSSIRNKIQTGLLDKIEVSDLSDELRTARVETIRAEIESLREAAQEFEDEGKTDHGELLRSQASDLDEAIQEATDG